MSDIRTGPDKKKKRFTLCCGASRTRQSVNQADFPLFTKQVQKTLLLEANSHSSRTPNSHKPSPQTWMVRTWQRGAAGEWRSRLRQNVCESTRTNETAGRAR